MIQIILNTVLGTFGLSEQISEYIKNMDALDFFNAFIALLIVLSVVMGLYMIISEALNKGSRH